MLTVGEIELVMTNLLSLPVELLLHILSLLPPDRWKFKEPGDKAFREVLEIAFPGIYLPLRRVRLQVTAYPKYKCIAGWSIPYGWWHSMHGYVEPEKHSLIPLLWEIKNAIRYEIYRPYRWNRGVGTMNREKIVERIVWSIKDFWSAFEIVMNNA